MPPSVTQPLAASLCTPLPAAAEALLRAAPDAVLTADDDGFTPVHMAAYGGHAGVLSLLLASRRFPSLATLPSTDGGWTAGEIAPGLVWRQCELLSSALHQLRHHHSTHCPLPRSAPGGAGGAPVGT